MLVLFAIYAPSCVDEEAQAMYEESMLTEARKDIRAEFETAYLSKTSLFAYESTAKQKFSDFVDYLNILADISLDMSFRLKAGEMIQNTFLSENINIQLSQPGDKQSQKLNIQKLVKKGLKNELSFPNFSVGTIQVRRPLQRTNETSYIGSLSFLQNVNVPSQIGEILNVINRNVDIFLIKEEKVFGADTLRVWSVKLGDIR